MQLAHVKGVFWRHNPATDTYEKNCSYLPDYKVSLFNMNLRASQKDWQPCNRSVLMRLVYMLSYSSFNSR